ncbi:MAG: hypothetical protein AAB658_13375, partial [Chloroflexota bacterium]
MLWIQLGLGLLTLVLSVLVLGMVARFWWRHRNDGLSIGWWFLALAFGAFAVSQLLEFRRLLASGVELSSLELATRFVFMSILLYG